MDQAKTGAGADRFCGEKWLEHMRLDFRKNTGPVTSNLNEKLIVFHTRPNTNSAGSIDGMNGVIN